MKNAFYESKENYSVGEGFSVTEALDNLNYNTDGLIPVVAQDSKTKTVLMLAWMNKTSLQMTLETQCMTYWSRSRQSFWKKGETSGNIQLLQEMHIDCDGDSILCLVDQTGGACHTGRTDCFYWDINFQENKVIMSQK